MSLTCQVEQFAGYKWNTASQDCEPFSITGCWPPPNPRTYEECIVEQPEVTKTYFNETNLLKYSVIVSGMLVLICVVLVFLLLRRKNDKK
jgi:hypothetical protein